MCKRDGEAITTMHLVSPVAQTHPRFAIKRSAEVPWLLLSCRFDFVLRPGFDDWRILRLWHLWTIEDPVEKDCADAQHCHHQPVVSLALSNRYSSAGSRDSRAGRSVPGC